jgi:predicted dehydrogenase
MRNDLSRRKFIGVSAAAGASLMSVPALANAEFLTHPEPRGGAPVRFGIVGVGMQGSFLLAESIKQPEVECGGACDLYDGRHVLAREIVRPDLPVTRRYQDLLNDASIQALIVAVPDHWHRQIVVDAVNAGKDVYCEKPMSHTPADGLAMVEAARKTGRIVQVGSQRVSSAICAKAREMIASGIIGDLTMAEAQLGRNEPSGAWQYPPPPDLSPANLDWDTWLGRGPRRPFDPILFARWRAWREFGTGLAGDLLVHLISGMMYMLDLNRAPTQAVSVGGIRRWKDGRNTPDVHTIAFDYAGLPISMRLNLGCAVPELYRIQGSKGYLEITGNSITVTPQAGVDRSPSYYANSFPRALREAYFAQWNKENPPPPPQLTELTTIRGPHYDDARPHLAVFFDAVRTRKPVVEDATFGHHAALACHMANESYFRKAAVTWDGTSIKG